MACKSHDKAWMLDQLDLRVIREEITKYWDVVEITCGDVKFITKLQTDNAQLKWELEQQKEKCKKHEDELKTKPKDCCSVDGNSIKKLEAENARLKLQLTQREKDCQVYKDEIGKICKQLKDCQRQLKDCEKELQCYKNRPPQIQIVKEYCTRFVYIPQIQIVTQWCTKIVQKIVYVPKIRYITQWCTRYVNKYVYVPQIRYVTQWCTRYVNRYVYVPQIRYVTQYCTRYVYQPCQRAYYGCYNWCRRWY